MAKASAEGKAACVKSGLFDLLIEVVTAFEAGGVEGLQTVGHPGLYYALSIVTKCRSAPGCEHKIRGVAKALAFCLDHRLDYIEGIGATTDSAATALCCSVFGRDEAGSEFTFTQKQVDMLLSKWMGYVQAIGVLKTFKPGPDNIFTLDLCISDTNKELLLANADFVPYLADALLLDPGHPRAGLAEEQRIWLQNYHAQCFAQLAVYLPARERLRQDQTVAAALEAVAENGLSTEAQEHAAAALLAMSDKQLQVISEGQRHVMLSCERF
eukprot:COSAG02_NODE_12374_length_1556_cov_1.731640_2_plen_268_part_01